MIIIPLKKGANRPKTKNDRHIRSKIMVQPDSNINKNTITNRSTNSIRKCHNLYSSLPFAHLLHVESSQKHRPI